MWIESCSWLKVPVECQLMWHGFAKLTFLEKMKQQRRIQCCRCDCSFSANSSSDLSPECRKRRKPSSLLDLSCPVRQMFGFRWSWVAAPPCLLQLCFSRKGGEKKKLLWFSVWVLGELISFPGDVVDNRQSEGVCWSLAHSLISSSVSIMIHTYWYCMVFNVFEKKSPQISLSQMLFIVKKTALQLLPVDERLTHTQTDRKKEKHLEFIKCIFGIKTWSSNRCRLSSAFYAYATHSFLFFSCLLLFIADDQWCIHIFYM